MPDYSFAHAKRIKEERDRSLRGYNEYKELRDEEDLMGLGHYKGRLEQ